MLHDERKKRKVLKVEEKAIRYAHDHRFRGSIPVHGQQQTQQNELNIR